MLEQIVMGRLQQTAKNHCLTVAEQQYIKCFKESVQSKSSGPKNVKKNQKTLRYFGNTHAPLSTNAKFHLPSSYKLLLQHL